MRDEFSLFKIGYFVWNKNFLAFNAIKTIPEAYDVVNRSGDALVLMIDI